MTEHGTFSVIVIDMAHYDQASEMSVQGFPSLELAREYARRRTRASLEELRTSDVSHADLRRAWYIFGEDCIVVGTGDYQGASELDYFIAHPATLEEQDWRAIEVVVIDGR